MNAHMMVGFDDRSFVTIPLDDPTPQSAGMAPEGHVPIEAIFARGSSEIVTVSQGPHVPGSPLEFTIGRFCPTNLANNVTSVLALDEFKAIGANKNSHLVVGRRSEHIVVHIWDKTAFAWEQCISLRLKDTDIVRVTWDDKTETWTITFVSMLASGGKMPLRKREFTFGYMNASPEGALLEMKTWKKALPDDASKAWISDNGKAVGLTSTIRTELFNTETGEIVNVIRHELGDRKVEAVTCSDDLTTICLVSVKGGAIEAAVYPEQSRFAFSHPTLEDSGLTTYRVRLSGDLVLVSASLKSLFQHTGKYLSVFRRLNGAIELPR